MAGKVITLPEDWPAVDVPDNMVEVIAACRKFAAEREQKILDVIEGKVIDEKKAKRPKRKGSNTDSQGGGEIG